MTQAQLPYVLLYLGSTFLASVSQVLLKKAAMREHKSLLAEYTDWRVILGYGLFVGCTLLTMLAYRGVPLNVGPVLEATGYLYVTIFGVTIFHERMNPKKIGALALLVYLSVPNGLTLRPAAVPGDDIFAEAVRALYRSDTPTNVCPSIHVFNSVTLMLAYYRSECFDLPRRRWMRPAAMVLCLSICASTMLLKQHSVIDVVFGTLLALALDYAATLLQYESSPLHRRVNRKQRLPEWR